MVISGPQVGLGEPLDAATVQDVGYRGLVTMKSLLEENGVAEPAGQPALHDLVPGLFGLALGLGDLQQGSPLPLD